MLENKKRILIIGANFSNKGAEAMLKTVREQFIAQYGDVVCYMLCRNYERDLAIKNEFIPVCRKRQGRFVRKFKSYSYRAKSKIYRLFYGKNKPWYFEFPFIEIQRIIDELDAVLDVSGFAYADSWGVPMIQETNRLVDLCKAKGVRFYFLPQAWGSFEQPDVARSIKKMLPKANKFYARDVVSRQHIARALEVDETVVPISHDIVFSFQGKYPANAINGRFERKSNRMLIGISPNLRVYEKAAGIDMENQYSQLLTKVIRYCIEELDADVLLVPNEIFPHKTNQHDDRYLCRLLYNHINQRDRCLIVDHYASAEEIKFHIGQLDVLVGSRFHALIFGFLQAIPVMAISWSHKYRELFALFEMEEFVLESEAISDVSIVLAKLEQLIAQGDLLKERIASRLPALGSDIDGLFRRLLI
jgi:Uncharacterized conserved protein